MYALIELVHGDYGPTFETRQEAEAAFARLVSSRPGDAAEFGVFELDDAGYPIVAVRTDDDAEPQGINDRKQLATAEAALRRRTNEAPSSPRRQICSPSRC